MKTKRADGVLYLWLGVMGGWLVFIFLCFAVVFAWHEELTSWYYHDEMYVKEVQAKPLPYDQLLNAAQAAVPGKKLYGSPIKQDARCCYEFTTYLSCDTCSGITPRNATVYWDKIYVDPYTAKVTGIVDMHYNWIELNRRLFQNLLLRY